MVQHAGPPEEPQVDLGSVTERLVKELAASEHLPTANDLLGRLSSILLDVAVLESAKRGLLGNVDALVVDGDGSPLRAGANRFGKRVCHHSFREHCDCPRVFTDPDATWGWDSHRKVWFFGHHFYETSVSVQGIDLPLSIRLERGITPVMKLAKDAPAQHPDRPDLRLSKRGAPLCQGNAEMAYWGSGGKGTTLFICPKKANKCERCPIAPDGEPDWVCRPDLKWGPAVNIRTDQNPRLCPPIPRNSPRYEELYNLRSGVRRGGSGRVGACLRPRRERGVGAPRCPRPLCSAAP